MSGPDSAQGEPLKPCPFCGNQPGGNGRWVWCCFPKCPMLCHEVSPEGWNRRAAPPAPAGEVGELVKWLEGRAVADELRDNPDGAELCRRAAAALTAQAAALEEAEGKGDDLAKALRATAEGAAHYMNKFMAADADLTEARAVLSALGAVKGPDGWTVPCPKCVRGMINSRKRCDCPSGCRIPVPLAALEEGEPRHE